MKKLVSALCMMLVGLTPALSQQTQQPKPTPTSESAEDVIRVNTSLVQTSITVFDKKGNFVEGLGPADFELRIDGKPDADLFSEQSCCRYRPGTIAV